MATRGQEFVCVSNSHLPTWLVIALLGLPLTHAPTVDLPFRWRITEIIMWLFTPLIFQKRKRIRTLGTKLFVMGMAAYISYTGIVAIVMSPFIPIEIPAALEGTISPIFRAIIESARFLAALALVKALFINVSSEQDFEMIVRYFIISGMFLFVYAVYEITVLYLGFGLPLLPGSRSIPGFPVAATMYEASTAGTYGSIVAIWSLSMLVHRTRIMVPLCGLIVGVGTVIVTTSRAGVAALAIGAIMLIVMWMLQRRVTLKALSALLIGSAMGWLLIRIAQNWLGQLFFKRFNLYSAKYYMGVMMEETYSRVIPDLLQWPLGVGQGMWLYLVGGGASGPRLVVEGGIVGTLFLFILMIGLLLGLASCAVKRIPLSDGIVASVVATLMSFYKYTNVTDIWIWFILSLPMVASEIYALKQKR